jgi:predicted component of type VI protein secretion system
VHPFDAYRALCGLAGSLSMFSPDMRSCPSFPLYDHEDIGGRFDQVIRIIKGHLHSTVKRTWDRLTFERAADSPYRYDCKLKDDWVDGTYALYLGVESELAATEIEQRMMSQMKIAAPNDISNILGAVVRGVTLAPQSRVPAALPEHAHTHYYLLDAERTDDLRWRPVRESRAICLVGDPKDANIQFHIYAAKRG